MAATSWRSTGTKLGLNLLRRQFRQDASYNCPGDRLRKSPRALERTWSEPVSPVHNVPHLDTGTIRETFRHSITRKSMVSFGRHVATV
jgi:hypothetical protein